MVQPFTPRLQACTGCYYKKQHEIKLNTSENGTVNRHNKTQDVRGYCQYNMAHVLQ